MKWKYTYIYKSSAMHGQTWRFYMFNWNEWFERLQFRHLKGIQSIRFSKNKQHLFLILTMFNISTIFKIIYLVSTWNHIYMEECDNVNCIILFKRKIFLFSQNNLNLQYLRYTRMLLITKILTYTNGICTVLIKWTSIQIS